MTSSDTTSASARRPGPAAVPERVLVVVPAYNEEQQIATTLAEIAVTNPAVHLLVVDDGSTDGTAAAASACGVPVCRLPFNLGVGGAMRAGYRYAVRHGYDAVVQVDADGQHDPRYLPALVSGLAGADLVIGVRFGAEGPRYEVSWVRRLAMMLLAVTLSRMARTRLTDVTSGFRAVNLRTARLFAAHYPAEYLGDTVESTVIAVRAGCVVAQREVCMRPRQSGRASQSTLRAALYLGRAVAALSLAFVREWPETSMPVDPLAEAA